MLESAGTEPHDAEPVPERRPVAEQPSPSSVPGGPSQGAERPVSSVGRTVVLRPRGRMLAFLIEKEGEQIGRASQLDEHITDIGRDPRNHVTVSDAQVSGFHLRIERTPDDRFVVTDRNSSNGTWLNGQRLLDAQPMAENDEIRIGTTTLVFKVVT